MKQKAMPAGRQGFAPIVILIFIIILGLVGYFVYKNYLDPNGPHCKVGYFQKQCKKGPCCCPIGAICD